MTTNTYRAPALRRFAISDNLSGEYDYREAESAEAILDIIEGEMEHYMYADDEASETLYVEARATEVDEDDDIIEDGDTASRIVQLDPDEPDCYGSAEHDWRAPQSVVGGIESNPGVVGHGGGVIITEACRACGKYRNTDTWGRGPSAGSQGYEVVSYQDADDISLAYVVRAALRDAGIEDEDTLADELRERFDGDVADIDDIRESVLPPYFDADAAHDLADEIVKAIREQR